jgi:uncharacterized membrane protein
MQQNRFKSPVLWGALVAQVVSLLALFGVIDLQLGELVNQGSAIALQILVLIGVLNNPSDKENW